MSSILDALNKLEEERNRQMQTEQRSEEDNTPFEPEEAAAKLLMYEPLSRKETGARERAKTTAAGTLPRWVTAIVSLMAVAAVVSSAVAMVLVYQVLQDAPPRQAYTVPVVVETPAASVPSASSKAGGEIRKSVPVAANTGAKKSALPTVQPVTEPVVPPSELRVESARPPATPPAGEPAALPSTAPVPVPPPAVPALAAQVVTAPAPESPPASVPEPVSAAVSAPSPSGSAEPAPTPLPGAASPSAGVSVAIAVPAPSESEPEALLPSKAMPPSAHSGVSTANQIEPKGSEIKVTQVTSDEPVEAARDGLTPPKGLPGNLPVLTPPVLPTHPPAVLSTASTRAAETMSVRKSAGFVEPEAVNALPRLTLADQERYGLGELRLNVLREAGPGNPDPVAIINLKKVYLGEQIPGTRARLVGISSRAIAIEIEGTGTRFRVSR